MIVKTKLCLIFKNKFQILKAINLTDRELQIIKLICRQLTSREIAKKMGLGLRTIEGYRLNLQKKIKAKNTVGVVLYALKAGIVTLR